MKNEKEIEIEKLCEKIRQLKEEAKFQKQKIHFPINTELPIIFSFCSHGIITHLHQERATRISVYLDEKKDNGDILSSCVPTPLTIKLHKKWLSLEQSRVIVRGKFIIENIEAEKKKEETT